MSSLGYGDGPSAQTNLEYLWAITCQVRVRVRVRIRVRVGVRVRVRFRGRGRVRVKFRPRVPLGDHMPG